MFKNYDIKVCEIFKEAENVRKKLNHEFVGTEHLFLSVLKLDKSINDVFKRFNVFYENFYSEIESLVEKANSKIVANIYTPLLKKIILKCENEQDMSAKNMIVKLFGEGEGVAIRVLSAMDIDVDAIYNFLKSDKKEDLLIYKYGKCLNKYVSLSEKVVGRDKEINLIIETLLRKKKNNPLLIGDAGVGKSAIVEELTRKIIKGDVPDVISNKKIVMLEMGTLVSGTRYRGEFEERLSNIIDELVSNPDIILFIDEIHSMVNAGAAEGAISASDILKPYLARGEIKCIGATTKSEYEKYILPDKALMRRFELVFSEEPNETETIDILKNIKEEYVNFHKVNISNQLLESLVHLAGTYFPNRKNPDKSIELLDSVLSFVKLKNSKSIIKEKEIELKKLELQKVSFIENGNFKKALEVKCNENKIINEIDNLKYGKKLFVKEDDIIDVLEFKNNLFLKKDKIKNLKGYDTKIINKLVKIVKSKNRQSTFLIKGDYKEFIKDLKDTLNSQLIKIKDEDDVDKVFNKLKYYPNSIIVVEDSQNIRIKNLLKRITRDNLLEYNNEYINFSNVIIFVIAKENNIGFVNNFISDIPYDEVLVFSQKTLI